mgnify:FL=1
MNAKRKYFKMKNRSTVLCKSVLFIIKLKFKCFRLVKTFEWSWLVYRWECSIAQTFGNNKALYWTWWLRLCILNQYSSKETNGYAFLCFKFLLSHLYSFVITSVRICQILALPNLYDLLVRTEKYEIYIWFTIEPSSQWKFQAPINSWYGTEVYTITLTGRASVMAL